MSDKPLPTGRLVAAPPSSFEEISVGDAARLDRVVSNEDIERYAALTGDDNPVHVDKAFAREIGLSSPVAHGMLTAGYVSTVIGTSLPGPGALWLDQAFSFRAAVRAGDRLVVQVVVRHISVSTRVVTLDVEVRNQRDQVVLDGQARVHVLDRLPDVSDQSNTGAAVVTGASRGIGASIARRLAADGLPVVVNYRSDETAAKQVADAIRDDGGSASVFQADISDPDAVRSLFEHATAEHGPVGVLVNNAGGGPARRALTDTSWADLGGHLDTHLRGSFLCVQAVLPGMVDRGFGRIISITSQSAYGTPPVNMTGYVVAKSALAAFTRCIALEAGPHGVTANCVAPGMVDTDLQADVPQRLKMAEAARTPLRRLGDSVDVAEAVAYLAGPGGGYVTGQTIHLSGGQVMQ